MKLSTFFAFAKPQYLWRNRRGFCHVCGHQTLFLLNAPLDLIRNHALCVRCGSVSRHRHLARCVLEHFKNRGIGTLRDFGHHPEIQVFNSVSFGCIVKQMGQHPNIICSEHFDGVAPGDYKNGVLCEDFEKLSFEDDCFDLVLSEDVFEHLKDFRKGFEETFRILKRNGVHIFSIPFYFSRKTEPLFEFRDGKEIPLGPVEYHGDPIRGKLPAYNHFGYDLFDLLEKIGFETRLHISQYEDELKYGTFNCFTFISQRK